MPLAKTPFIRFRIINQCLTNRHKPYPTIEEIQEQLSRHDINVQRRQIERDLATMRHDERVGYNAPIEYCKKNRGYYYTDPEYSIDKFPLTAEELAAFEVSLAALKCFKGATVLQHVEGVFDKLDKLVAQHKSKPEGEREFPVIDFEKVPYYKGIDHFDAIHQAILNKEALVIGHRKFETDACATHIFHPYQLKEYKFRWYVPGFSESRNSILILGLDRIVNIEKASAPFMTCNAKEVQTYFDHLIGVTLPMRKVQEIRLWFSSAQGHYIKTQHLHSTQKIVSDDASGVIVTLQLIPNYELIQTLLSFGAAVKVLQPSTLRDELKELLRKSLAMYTG